MLVFWKEKLVLLAVPKTGTTALERALLPRASMAILDPPGLKHLSARRYRAEIEPMVTAKGADPHETVAVIREPIDWLGSWYRYRRRPQLRGQEASTEGIDFDGFVRAWMTPEPPPFARVGSQARFLTGGRGRLIVRHLFAYEDYGALIRFLEDRFGTPLAPEPVNVSPRMPLVLSDEVEADLRRHAAHDFRLWDRARAARG
ncbi:gamma-glutamyl kinase [Rhodobacterales bacterium HKCCE2091]|nr:gamma-glutamyl kinase [Rhodobacterales bacterium HKCCE2091]